MTLGAHPERRVLTPARRAGLRRAAAPQTVTRLAAVVLAPVVNLFSGPDARTPVVSQSTIGTVLLVTKSRHGWALVETPDRYSGWVRSRALRPLRAAGNPGYASGRRTVEVISLLAHVYRSPDVTSASPISVAPFLSRLEAIWRGADWVKVRLPDGREGWMQKGDTKPSVPIRKSGARTASAAPVNPAGVVATALRFLGLPYLWGGTTPFGLDCSGFTQLVYRAHGCLLPRDSDQQFADGRLAGVPRSKVAAGDLVFFGPAESSITHVGIALGPDGFINATTYRQPVVRIDRLDDPYWRSLYRGARRRS